MNNRRELFKAHKNAVYRKNKKAFRILDIPLKGQRKFKIALYKGSEGAIALFHTNEAITV
ncbi:MAG TPA: hypothetical protein DCE14_01385 [Kosmotogaceae bacterium]|nr:hypothetical protein [Kosmotogaceae bacterium]